MVALNTKTQRLRLRLRLRLRRKLRPRHRLRCRLRLRLTFDVRPYINSGVAECGTRSVTVPASVLATQIELPLTLPNPNCSAHDAHTDSSSWAIIFTLQNSCRGLKL